MTMSSERASHVYIFRPGMRAVPLLPGTAAFLVFLPAPERAWSVAAPLFARPPLRGLARVSRARHAGRLQLPLLLSLELFFHRVDGRRGLPPGPPNFPRLRDRQS